MNNMWTSPICNQRTDRYFSPLLNVPSPIFFQRRMVSPVLPGSIPAPVLVFQACSPGPSPNVSRTSLVSNNSLFSEFKKIVLELVLEEVKVIFVKWDEEGKTLAAEVFEKNNEKFPDRCNFTIQSQFITIRSNGFSINIMDMLSKDRNAMIQGLALSNSPYKMDISKVREGKLDIIPVIVFEG